MNSSAKRRTWALFVACAAAGSLAYAALVRGPQGGPLDAVPAGSYLAAQLDVEALRASPLYGALEKDRTFASLGDLALACGFDPLTRIKELDLAIPEGGDPGDFGIAASADLTQEELVRCAENVAGTHGDARKVERIGRFYLTADAKDHALAVAEGGPILVGRTPWVRAMIDAAEKRAPSLRSNKEHMALRDALGSANPARPLLVVTAILPRDLRERLKKEMSAEASEPGANATMASVLGVSAVGLLVRSGADGVMDTRAELRCESESACADIAKLVLTKRLAWSQDLALRIVGLGPMIDSLEVNAHGTAVTLTTRTYASDLTSLLGRLSKLKEGKRREARPRPPADEVLRPRDKNSK